MDRLTVEMRRLFEMMARGTCGKIHIHLYMDLVRWAVLLALRIPGDDVP